MIISIKKNMWIIISKYLLHHFCFFRLFSIGLFTQWIAQSFVRSYLRSLFEWKHRQNREGNVLISLPPVLTSYPLHWNWCWWCCDCVRETKKKYCGSCETNIYFFFLLLLLSLQLKNSGIFFFFYYYPIQSLLVLLSYYYCLHPHNTTILCLIFSLPIISTRPELLWNYRSRNKSNCTSSSNLLPPFSSWWSISFLFSHYFPPGI